MVDVALSLGTNSGNRHENMRRMEEMAGALFLGPVRMSSLMETEPLEVDNEQPWFLNRIIGGSFVGDAWDLLDACNTIERVLGRRDKGKRLERTADVDILLFGSAVIATEGLIVPHPGIRTRRFCLAGLVQIMADAVAGDPPEKISEWYRTMDRAVGAQKIRFIDAKGGHSDI